MIEKIRTLKNILGHIILLHITITQATLIRPIVQQFTLKQQQTLIPMKVTLMVQKLN